MVLEKKVCEGCDAFLPPGSSPRRRYHNSTCRTRAWKERGSQRPKDDLVARIGELVDLAFVAAIHPDSFESAVVGAYKDYKERVRG